MAKKPTNHGLAECRQEALALWDFLNGMIDRLKLQKAQTPQGGVPLVALVGQLRAMRVLADDLESRLGDYIYLPPDTRNVRMVVVHPEEKQ